MNLRVCEKPFFCYSSLWASATILKASSSDEISDNLLSPNCLKPIGMFFYYMDRYTGRDTNIFHYF